MGKAFSRSRGHAYQMGVVRITVGVSSDLLTCIENQQKAVLGTVNIALAPGLLSLF